MSGPVLQFNTCESGPSNPCNPAIRYAAATASNCSASILPDMASWCDNFDFDSEGTAWNDNAAAIFNDCNTTPDSYVAHGGETTGSGAKGFGSSLLSGIGLSGTGTLTAYRAQIWVPAGRPFAVVEVLYYTPYLTGPQVGYCGTAVLAACTASAGGTPCSGGLVELYVPNPNDVGSYTAGCESTSLGLSLSYFLVFIGTGSGEYTDVGTAINDLIPYNSNPLYNDLVGYGPDYSASATCFAAPDDALYGTGGGYP